MCIIIDANRLGDFLAEPRKSDVLPIHDWLRDGGKIIYSTGGKFATEIGGKAKRRFEEYVRRGSADQVPYPEISAAVNELRSKVKSDDPHVIALARHRQVRVLYTHDQDLIDDFKDKRFIDRPRGTVYKGAGNADLLTSSLCRRR